MTKRIAADTEELLERASVDRQSEGVGREKRYIFNGDPPPQYPGYAIRPNAKATRRKVSTFNIILVLFGVAVSTVLYIGNFIAVNQLAFEVNQLQTKYEKITHANAVLEADINRKSSWERIGTIATAELGLQHPKEQPVLVDIEEDKLERVGTE